MQASERETVPTGAWRKRWRQVLDGYEASEPDAARFRARQLQAVLRLTPAAMAINVANVLVVCFVAWPLGRRAALLLWAVAVCAAAAMGLAGWLRTRRRAPREQASRRALRHAAVQAAVLGLLWALLPLTQWPVADPPTRFFIGMVTTGMICAGGFALCTVPVAATAYVLTLTAGAILTLLIDGSRVALGTVAMLSSYGLIVVYSVWVQARSFGARLMAEALADRNNEVIGLLLRDFEDHASDLLWELDARGRFVHASPRLAEALGVPLPRLQQGGVLRLLRRRVPATDDALMQWRALRALLGGRTAFRDRVLTLHTAQGQRWWSVSAKPLPDAGRWRGVAADITERQMAQRRLSWLAHNDTLTGLCNRAQFRELMGMLLGEGTDFGHAGAPPPALAVLVFDLDDFKRVNDTLGHAAGDALLQSFGQRLRAVARRSDVVARLGGDEFAMLVPGAVSRGELENLVGRLRSALAEPCLVEGQALQLRASVGVACAPLDGRAIDELLNNADIAMYAAKHAGGDRAAFFDSHLADSGRRRAAVEQALRGAMARGELRLAFQAQVLTDDWQVCGFEALLRWTDPELGEVSPSEFVPVAESAGLMPEIGNWVLAQACRAAAGWPGRLRVSVNVSATQLAAGDLVEHVRGALAAARLPAERLELEITESTLIADADAAIETLRALRAMGCRTALDDFGTGYSALGYLRRFPFDVLKIDRSFVRDLVRDAEARVLVDTILAMARALHMTTVAEGVESEAEARLLRERGCGVVQGFLLSRPLPPAELVAFLAAWRGMAQRLLSEDLLTCP